MKKILLLIAVLLVPSISQSTIVQYPLLFEDTLTFTPADSVLSGRDLTEDGMLTALDEYGVGDLVYKAQRLSGEWGEYEDNYSTCFFDDLLDPQSANIYHNGDRSIIDPSYAVVRDTWSDPNWYAFDISGWDGTSTLEFRDFWPDCATICSVYLFEGGDQGDDPNPVPEPATMLLFGVGLAGLVGMRKRHGRNRTYHTEGK